MRLDSNPIYRKIIVPWYDSGTVCVMMILFMAAVLLFGAVGIFAAYETPGYDDHVWVPVSLVVMSLFVTVSAGIRLAKRHLSQPKE